MKNCFPNSVRKEDQNYVLILFQTIMRMKIFNNVANFKWSNNRSDMLNIMVLLITGTYHFPHSLAVNIKL